MRGKCKQTGRAAPGLTGGGRGQDGEPNLTSPGLSARPRVRLAGFTVVIVNLHIPRNMGVDS